MKTKEKSIELLNNAIAEELSAVHQYMYFHFYCDDYGYDPISNIFRRIAIIEMTHVERLAERIRFLKGEVEMKLSHPVAKIHEVEKMLEKATEMENTSVNEYNEWARVCAENADSVTKKMFEDLAAEEEKHEDIFDTEKDNLSKFGANYLALQSLERSKSEAAGSEPNVD